MMKIAKMLRNRKGFTLVELMVVVVIIGVLSAIAVPMYNQATARAEAGAIQANLRTIDGAILQITASTTDLDSVDSAAEIEALLPKYIKDFASLSPGTYSVIANGSSFVGQVTVTGGVGGLTAGSYRLVGNTLTTVGGGGGGGDEDDNN